MMPIDNSADERSIRCTYCIGRNNWLFSTSMDGAKVNAIAYSLTETAKRNNADPYFYIQYIMDKMPQRVDVFGRLADGDKLDDMMPWSPEYRAYEEEQKQILFQQHNETEPPPPPNVSRKRKNGAAA